MHPDTLAGDATAARTLHAWLAYADAEITRHARSQGRTRAFLILRAAARAATLAGIGVAGAAGAWVTIVLAVVISGR